MFLVATKKELVFIKMFKYFIMLKVSLLVLMFKYLIYCSFNNKILTWRSKTSFDVNKLSPYSYLVE